VEAGSFVPFRVPSHLAEFGYPIVLKTICPHRSNTVISAFGKNSMSLISHVSLTPSELGVKVLGTKIESNTLTITSEKNLHPSAEVAVKV